MNDKIRTNVTLQTLQLFNGGMKEEQIAKTLTLLYPEENNIFMVKSIHKTIEMFVSLQKAIQKAGGVGWSVVTLECLNVVELIARLATNDVRFIYQAPSKMKKKGI